MSELWKGIPGYEGRYQVSNQGRVRSLDRTIRFPGYTTRAGIQRSPSLRSFKGTLLALGPSKSGHLSVPLGRPTIGRQVHQLVLLAFVGPCPTGHEVLHLDSDPTNNCLGNLKYGTRSENLKMDYARGVNRLHGKKKAAT